MMEQPADSLPPDTPSPDATRRAMWQWVGSMVGFVVASAILGGILFKVPYVALVPGSARDTEPLLQVEGIEAFPSEGELLLTTVRVRQRPNLWEYLWLQTDKDAEIVPEEVILGGRSPEENREFNLQLMTDSKSVAIAVALEELGYDAIQTDGVIIAELVPGAAAETALSLGDTVVGIDGEPVQSSGDLVEVLGRYEPGDEITLLVERFDPANPMGHAEDEDVLDESGQVPTDPAERYPNAETVSVELGAKPDDAQAAFLGVGPSDRVTFNNDFDFVVDIDSGAVGGPSAGLAFTLAVLDELTEGELTGGATVAVTGTIDPTGRVGPVGGVAQKTAAVRDLGADVFLVPAGLPPAEIERVMERAGSDLEVIPVEDLGDALEALAGLGGEVAAVEEFAASNLS
ncbi:MAG: S16 family serine protease [Actinomycetota bacterium]